MYDMQLRVWNQRSIPHVEADAERLKLNTVCGLYTGAWNGLVLTCCKYCVFPTVMHSFSHQITDCILYLFTFRLVIYFTVRC